MDLGVKTLATFSNGETVVGSKPMKMLLVRLKRLSRSLSRKKKGSANWHKAKSKIAKLHARISNIRKDTLHQLTSDLTRRFETICIEDLNVSGMLKNRKLSRHIADMGFYDFRRQLDYKSSKMRGNQVVIADRFFPSSKTCSACGTVKQDLTLKDRVFECQCGYKQDRDLNAAINLANYAVSYTV